MEMTPRRNLFGRIKGKALRPHQSELVAEFLPTLSLDLARPFESAAATFGAPMRALRLEIGFGGGEHLIEAASREPDVGFLGCEPFVNGVAKLLTRIEARGLSNIRLHSGDAGDVLDWLAPGCLERAYLFYPDPWPKRRHRKRRFVREENLDRLSRALQQGAELRYATDIDDYAAWTLSRLRKRQDFAWTARCASDWRQPWADWTRTKYEAKAIAAGRKPVYLTFVKT